MIFLILTRRISRWSGRAPASGSGNIPIRWPPELDTSTQPVTGYGEGGCMRTAAWLLLLPVFGEKTERIREYLVGSPQFVDPSLQLQLPCRHRLVSSAQFPAADKCAIPSLILAAPPPWQCMVGQPQLLRSMRLVPISFDRPTASSLHCLSYRFITKHLS